MPGALWNGFCCLDCVRRWLLACVLVCQAMLPPGALAQPEPDPLCCSRLALIRSLRPNTRTKRRARWQTGEWCTSRAAHTPCCRAERVSLRIAREFFAEPARPIDARCAAEGGLEFL